MGERIFEKLVTWLIEGSIVVLIILALRFLMKNKLKKSLIYYLWLALIIKILIPISLESSISVFNIFNSNNIESKVTSTINKDVEKSNSFNGFKENNELEVIKSENEVVIVESELTVVEIENNEGLKNSEDLKFDEDLKTNEIREENKAEKSSGISQVRDLVGLIWLIVFTFFLAKTLVKYFNLRRKIKVEAIEYEIPKELNSVFKRLNIKRKISIKETDLVHSPMLIGQIKPIILIPRNLKEVISKEDLEFIILHELSHYKRLDIVILWLFKLVTILNFYNPLILYAYKLMKKDCEEACDEYVLSHIGIKDNLNYGRTIIKVIENINYNNVEIMGTTMAISKDEIRNRIINIKENKAFSKRNIIIGLALILLIFAITLTNKKNEKYTEINLNFLSKIEFIKEGEEALYKTIYEGEDLNEIVKLLEKLNLEADAIEEKLDFEYSINVYGEEDYSLNFGDDTVKFNNHIYSGDIDVIKQIKNTYEKLDYEEELYFGKSLSSYSKEVNNILKEMGYKPILEEGNKNTIIVPKNEDAVFDNLNINEVFERVALKGKESEESTKENLLNYKGEVIEISLYPARTIKDSKELKTFVVFIKDGKIISYYLTDSIELKSSFTDEMFLINSCNLNTVQSENDKQIKSILENAGYSILPNSELVSEITLPQSFDYGVNQRDVGGALERVYEKSIGSENETKDSLKNYFGKTLTMESYSVYETEYPDNLDLNKEFYLFRINDRLIAYYFIDLEDILTEKDEDIVRKNLIAEEKANYYDFKGLSESLENKGFKVEEVKSESIESDYIESVVKRYEAKVNNEDLVVYEFADNDVFKSALEILNISTTYDEKKHKLNPEDIKTENRVFYGENLIVLYEGREENLIDYLKEILNYKVRDEDKMTLTIKKDDVELHYYTEYLDREFKELILNDEVYEIKKFNKIVYQNSVTVSLKDFYKEISEFTGDSIKIKMQRKNGDFELVEILREDFYRSAFPDDFYVDVDEVYGRVTTTDKNRIEIGKKLTLKYFNLNKDNTNYNLRNGIRADRKVLVDNIRNIKVELIEEKGNHIIFKSEFKLDVLDIFRNDWLKGDFILSEDNKEMSKTLFFRVEKINSNEYRIIDVYDEL